MEELLTCKVCMERYNEIDRKPLFLNCGHTFCAKCLKYLYKKDSMKCPLDKKNNKFQ